MEAVVDSVKVDLLEVIMEGDSSVVELLSKFRIPIYCVTVLLDSELLMEVIPELYSASSKM